MDSLPIGPHTEIPEPSSSREGVSRRYSRSRTRAASREAHDRDGRTEEAQLERRDHGRSHRADETRSKHRDRRMRSKGRSKTQGAQNNRTTTDSTRPQGPSPDAGESEFAARLKSKTQSASKPSSQPGAGRPTDQGPRQEAPALAAAVTLAKPLSSAGKSTVAPSTAKAVTTPARGTTAVFVSDATVQTKEVKQRAKVATPREAAPTPERDQASDVLRQVRLQLFPEARTATVHLKPAELGRVTIRLVVTGDQVQAIVRAESPEALTALEQHMPELEAAFADRGFKDAQLDLALGFEGDDEDQLPSGSAVEPSPDHIHRLFANAEGVDFYA